MQGSLSLCDLLVDARDKGLSKMKNDSKKSVPSKLMLKVVDN